MRKVADIMTVMPIVASVPGDRNDVINLMVRKKLTGVPVVREKDGRLEGIVSRKDVFRNLDEEQLSMIMSKKITTIDSETSVKDAARIFVERRFHRLPIVDNGKLVGIVTPTDLLKEVAKSKTSMVAEDVITQKCVTIYEEDPLTYAVAAMKISDVTAFPVLDKKGKLSGVITDRDMFIDQTKGVKELKKLGIEISDELASYRDVLPLFYIVAKKEIPEGLNVKKYMVTEPITVFKKKPLSQVAKLMIDKDFGQVPVMGNDDELLGMIYDVDVLKALVGKSDA